MKSKLFAVDLFAGCGGLTQGLKDAGFTVFAAVESDADAVAVYKLNHRKTKVFQKDIRKLPATELIRQFPKETSRLHLLAACPPCQGFSSLRRKNRRKSIFDKRNSLILDVVRFVRKLRPRCIMLENVPGLQNYYLYKKCVRQLKKMGYHLEEAVVDVADYHVPQHRERLILLGSRVAQPSLLPPRSRRRTVRDQIGTLPPPRKSRDELHRWTMVHTPKIKKLIAHIPKNGGSRRSLPKRFKLRCHDNDKAGFCDVYGRLRWDDVSVTITGGCLNPSKGRFLHPRQNRAITPREAALLQTFPPNYRFISKARPIAKDVVALLIGNALPPTFSKLHSRSLARLLRR